MQLILQFLFIWLVIDSVYFPNEHVKNTHEIYMEIALFIRINWAIIQWPIRCYKIFPMLCDLSYVKQIRTCCSIPPNRIYPLKKNATTFWLCTLSSSPLALPHDFAVQISCVLKIEGDPIPIRLFSARIDATMQENYRFRWIVLDLLHFWLIIHFNYM